MSAGDDRFPSTLWGVLRPGTAAATRHQALEALAELYSAPIRRWFRSAARVGDEEAEELFLTFFAWVMESGFLEKARPERGRFRALLKTALRRFLVDRARAAGSVKRGGGRTTLSLFSEDATPAAIEPRSSEPAPDEALDAEWRLTTLDEALRRMEAELGRRGREASFRVFRARMIDADERDSDTLARDFDLGVHEVGNAISRGKRLFRRLIEEVVRETVDSREEFEDELNWLLDAGAGS